MTSPLPTSPALDDLVAALVHRCRPYFNAGPAIEAIRREQDHCSIESVGRHSYTRPDPAQQDVFDLDAFRRARCEVHNDDEPEAA